MNKYVWCEHNKNITGTYSHCLICANKNDMGSDGSQDKLNKPQLTNALTPLGEELLKHPAADCPKRKCLLDDGWHCSRPQHGCICARPKAIDPHEHYFAFSHQQQEARGIGGIYKTVYYVICITCGQLKSQQNLQSRA